MNVSKGHHHGSRPLHRLPPPPGDPRGIRRRHRRRTRRPTRRDHATRLGRRTGRRRGVPVTPARRPGPRPRPADRKARPQRVCRRRGVGQAAETLTRAARGPGRRRALPDATR
ncbi:hypothetical protein B7R25_02015 [Subtercola boreus]|uniref:Uncharacterized protein n=1 Tax=Subtercola boreus TaxID=120213 RepID=A0A3E0WGS5_9MICO|nr:hypothetical protein B7R24_02020 [Subtercola boreus]RFA24063.1 hypothetical protein B7R23_02020 [Subtercola boreus]RFA29761.1 hypothetical protein B7R25_02015 [Subtercola boreus]